jgi:hypothetical protein
MKMNKLINLPAVGLALCLGGESLATEPFATTVEDHNKTVIKKIPQTVEICSHGNGKSDLENFITGAIIGGTIGNNIPGEKGGGAIGGILGGALNAERNKGMKCRTETHYKKQLINSYSHSTITFNYNNKTYTLTFQK